MNYYEINMESMRQFHPSLYQKLQDMDQYLSINRLDQIYSNISKNGELYLTVNKGNKEYRLNSSYSPRHEAQKWIQQFAFRNMNTVITMYGFGNGSFAREILDKKGEEDVLFVYEPCPQLFYHVLENYDISDLLNERKLIIALEGINEFDFHNLLQNVVNITNIRSQIRCTHPFYETIFPESGIKYWKEIKDNYFHTKLNINTEMFFGKRFIKNALFNARYLKDSNRLQDFKDDFRTDIPAIIVAAGPSLRKNIEYLKKVKGKAYIFVVDRVLDYVLDEGLEPDFIVTIDPMKPLEYFTRRTDLTIPLLCELVSNWEVLDRHKGKKIVYSCTPFFQKMYCELEKVPPMLNSGASVATAAFSACVQMGFENIVLVGQDLAYEGEFTHAGGIAEKIERTRDVMVEGVDGNQVRSRSDWYEFLVWFKDMITLNPKIKVIDAKEQGAKIVGSTVMPLKEVVDTLCTKEIDNLEVFKTKASTFNEADNEKIKKYFTDSYEELDILRKKSREAIKICKEQIKNYNINSEETPVTEKNFKKISKINDLIGKQSIYLLLETFITASSAQQISEIYHFSEDIKLDKIKTYERTISIFQSILDGVKYVKPIFEEMSEYI